VGTAYTDASGLQNVHQTINFTLQGRTEGWLGVGLAEPGQTHNKMLQADAYIGWVYPNGTVYMGDYKIGDQRSRNCSVPTSLGVCLDTVQGGQNNILDYSGSEVNGVTTLRFSRYWNTGDSKDYPVVAGMSVLVYAMGQTDFLSYHNEDKSYAEVDLMAGSLVPYKPVPVAPSTDCSIDATKYQNRHDHISS